MVGWQQQQQQQQQQRQPAAAAAAVLQLGTAACRWFRCHMSANVAANSGLTIIWCLICSGSAAMTVKALCGVC